MYKVATLCLCVIFFTGCNKKPENTAEPATQISELDLIHQQKQSLLEEFSGVWSHNHDLITIYYDGSDIHLVIDDEAKEVKLGDIDLQNETINLLVTKIDDYEQGIFTLRRIWNEDKTEFTLNFTSFDGSNFQLGFVRKIGNDDKTRIENIYTNQMNNTYEDEDPSTPAYDVSAGEDYTTHDDYETDYEADRIATEAANNAAMAAYESEMGNTAAAEAATRAANAATQAAEAAMEAENY